MSDLAFVGRKRELARLRQLYNKNMPNLVVLKGRRRVGKSRLIAHFVHTQAKGTFWSFAGLASAKDMTDQMQRDHFARQLSLLLKIPPMTFGDWSDAFEHLSLHLKAGDIILLDEISWMGEKDPSFIPKLKDWWDKQTLGVLVIFCGSVSTWIEDNILNSTSFFGRVDLQINLEPWSILESAHFLRKMNFKNSDYEMYKLLSLMGGIPWYLKQINSAITVDENIKQLAFEPDSLLVLEFDRIFHDLFNGTSVIYKKIMDSLKEGTKTLSQVRQMINFTPSGTLSSMMKKLMIAGFVQKQTLWSFKTEKPLKQSLYRISDPYMRFYLKLIEPNLSKITANGFQELHLATFPGFETHLGLQLEYLLLQNRNMLLKAIGISPMDIVNDGPYRQSATERQKGCQIDYLIQTSTKNLFICEFKFKKREIGNEIINEMEDKILALKVPKGFACVPILFHLSGVTLEVINASYFYRIIDITGFLDED